MFVRPSRHGNGPSVTKDALASTSPCKNEADKTAAAFRWAIYGTAPSATAPFQTNQKFSNETQE